MMESNITNPTINKLSKVIDKKIKLLEIKTSTQIAGLHEELNTIKGDIYRIYEKLDVLEERTAYLPKLYQAVDAFMKEILTNQQERVFIDHKLTQHEQRIQTIEKNVGIRNSTF